MNRRIVFVNRYFHPDQSATSQLLTDLSNALVRLGFDVRVICSRQRYDAAHARLQPRESVAGVTVYRVWSTRFGRSTLLGRAFDYATFYASSGWRMLAVVRRGDTLVAETDPPLISVVAMCVARFKGARLVNWLQDIFPEVASLLGANPLPRRLDVALQRIRDRSLFAASANVVLGARMGERLLGRGVAPGSIQIIENWSEILAGPPKPAAASALRARLGLDGSFVVGYSGNLGRAHEYQTLLGAADLLRADPQIVFLMIGGGSGMAQLERAVGERCLPNFRFLGYQPRQELSDSLAAAEVHWVSLLPALEGYIVPSKYYGILAAGRPVIFVGDGAGELARDIHAGECGAVVEVGDSAALAQWISRLKAQLHERERMGQAAYRRYCERYCAERAFRAWVVVLDRAAGAPGDAFHDGDRHRGARHKSYARL